MSLAISSLDASEAGRLLAEGSEPAGGRSDSAGHFLPVHRVGPCDRAVTGRLSDEARARISAASKARWADPRRRAAMSARMRGNRFQEVHWSADMDAALIRLRREGYGWRIVARRVGVAPLTAIRRADFHGLPRRLPPA